MIGLLDTSSIRKAAVGLRRIEQVCFQAFASVARLIYCLTAIVCRNRLILKVLVYTL